MRSVAFFPFGICGIISLLGIGGILAYLLYFHQIQKSFYRTLVSRSQNWFAAQFGPILVDRSGKRPIAWFEITLNGLKTTVILRPKDYLYRKYVAKTGDNAVELPAGTFDSVCVYGKYVIALKIADGKTMPILGKVEFESDLIPPDPRMVRMMRHNRIMVRVMMISAVPIAFFGLVWLFSGLL